MKTLLVNTFLGVVSLLVYSGCLNISVNNVWKVPGTELSVAVERVEAGRGNAGRTMTLRENYQDKQMIRLAHGSGDYVRINVYQMDGGKYILRDAYDTLELDTTAKTLTKYGQVVDPAHGKFVGAFDMNDNGSWRFIPVEERAEIRLGK
jgi:hypothetical protein